MSRLIKGIALALLATVIPCLGLGAEVYKNTFEGDATEGDATVNEVTIINGRTYNAKTFNDLTDLSTLSETSTGSFEKVIYKVSNNNDTQTHTFSMWVKVNELSDNKILWWVCGGSNGNHGGYAVKAMEDGTIRIGKTGENGASWFDKDRSNDSAYLATSTSCLEANTWAYVTIVITKTDNDRTATPAVYVNGVLKEMTTGTFATNLNGNGGDETYAQIGSGVTAAMISVDDTALTAAQAKAAYIAIAGNAWSPKTPDANGACLWSVDSNWSAGKAPESTDEVCILAETEGTTLTMGADATIATAVVSGSGSLQITGATLNASTVFIDANTTFVDATIPNTSPTIVINGGDTLTFNVSSDLGRAAKFSGDGTLVKNGTGKFTLWANVTTNVLVLDSIEIDVQKGLFDIAGSNRIPSIKNATITLANEVTFGTPNGLTGEGINSITVAENATATAFTAGKTITLNGELTKTGAGTLTIPAILAGSSPLTVSGGTLTLTGANTYTGKTTIAEGATLVANSDTASTWNFDENNIPNEIEVLGTLKLQSVGDAGIYRSIKGTGEVIVTGTSIVGNAAAQDNTGLSLFAGTLTVNPDVILKLCNWRKTGPLDYDIPSLSALNVNGSIVKDGGYNLAALPTITTKALSGIGSIGTADAQIPLTLADGATIDASTSTTVAGLTVNGTVTIEGDTVAVTLSNPAVGTKVITCKDTATAEAVAEKLTNSTYAFTVTDTSVTVAPVCTATIGDTTTSYASVQQAVDAGATEITVTKDKQETVTLAEGKTVTLTGFSGTVTDPYGNELSKGETEGTYTSNLVYVAQIETTKYLTIDAAITAGEADAAKTITLLKDVSIEGATEEGETKTIANPIAGAFKITILSGSVTFSNTNTYTGETEVASGATLNITKRGALGSGAVTGEGTVKLTGSTKGVNNAAGFNLTGVTLDLNEQYTYADDDSGYLTQQPFVLGGGAKVINGAVTPYTANNNTALTIVEYTGGAPATFAADVHSVYTNTDRTRKVVVAEGDGPAEEGVADYDLEITGDLGLSGGQFGATTLVKEGPGILKLSGANNLPALTISEGTVLVNNENALSATTTVESGATLDLNGQTVIVDTLRGEGEIVGTGTIVTKTIEAFKGTIGANVKIQYPLPYQLTWLPVGDSITEGEQYMGAAEGTGNVNTRGGYRYQLWNQLDTVFGQDVRSVGFRTGHSGTNEDPTTTDWAWHAALYGGDITGGSSGAQLFNVESTLEVAGYPDFISVMIGINDLSRTNTSQHANHFAAWAQLIDRYAKLRPHSKVLAATVLPVVSTNASADDFEPFNALIRAAAKARTTPFDNENVVFADIALNAFNNTYNASYFKTDGIHPNETGSKIVANAFRDVIIREVMLPLEEAMPSIVHVNNATEGQITVLFSKPIKSVSEGATVTITGTDVNGDSVNVTCAYEAINARAVTFTIPNETTLIAGDYTVTLNGTVTDVTNVTSDANLQVATAALDGLSTATCVEIYGSGAAANVPESFRNGFAPYQTLAVSGTDNYAGSLPVTGLTTHQTTEVTTEVTIAKAAYYVELQRAGQAPQFVWVSMDAEDITGATTPTAAQIGIPTTETGIKHALVDGLSVYGNRGNFDKNVTNGQGVIVLTPWVKSTAATTSFTAPAETHSGASDWNDTVTDTTYSFGHMQVARVRTERDTTKAVKYDPAAEMLFAFNGFNTRDGTDLGIGSMVVHRGNNGGENGTTAAALAKIYDWSRFYEKTAYTPFNLSSAYTVKSVEVWVAPAATTWTATAEADWATASNWSNGVPTANTDVIIPAGAAITLTAAAEAKSITISAVDGQNTVAISGAYSLTVTDTIVIDEGETLKTTETTLDAPVSGAGTLSTTILPEMVEGFTDETWTGNVILDGLTVVNLNLSEYGRAGSTITLKNVTGHWDHALVGTDATNSANWKLITIPANLCIEGTNTINDGYARQAYNLTGAITGTGSLVFAPGQPAAQGIYCFMGDIGGFTGEIIDDVGNPIVSIGKVLTYDRDLAGTHHIYDDQTIACELVANQGIVVHSDATIKGTGTLNATVTFEAGATVDATDTSKLLTVSAITGPVKVMLPAGEAQTSWKVFNGTSPDVAGATIEAVTIDGTLSSDSYRFVAQAEGCFAQKVDDLYQVGDATTLKSAVDALSSADLSGTITLTADITNLDQTIVIDVGDKNTVTLNLAGHGISSSATPVILVKSGTLKLETPSESTVATTTSATAIIVGTEGSSNPTLMVGAGVTVSSMDSTTIDLVAGTIGGTGTIANNLVLRDGAIVDVTQGVLTVNGTISFPGQKDNVTGGTTNSTVMFYYPEDTVFPRLFAMCKDATAEGVTGTTFCVDRLTRSNYGLMTINDNEDATKVLGYALKQYVCEDEKGGQPYTSVNEALRAGVTEIMLFADTTEDIILTSGTSLKLGDVWGSYTVTGNIIVQKGATLMPVGGDITGNLTLESGATLDVISEMRYPVFCNFSVSGHVSFPTQGGDLFVVVTSEQETIDLGEPQQLIACPNVTPGTVIMIAPETETGAGLKVVTGTDGGVASNWNQYTKIVTTSTTYELVTKKPGPCTYDGIDYASIEQALRAYTATSNKTITLNKLENTDTETENDYTEITLSETIVINVGDGNEVTLDLNGIPLTSTADPAIRIQSGKLNIINSKYDPKDATTAAKVSTVITTEETTTSTRTILVGASNNDGTPSTGISALNIGAGVIVERTAETTAVDVIAGTVGGTGAITGTLNLETRTIIDATEGALSVTDVVFPEDGEVIILPPANAGSSVKIIDCDKADANAIEATSVMLRLSDGSMVDVDTTHSESKGFRLIVPTETPDGYYLSVGLAAMTITGDKILYYAKFVDAVNDEDTTAETILIPLVDVTLETNIPCHLYTYGYNITIAADRTIDGTLTLAHGTVITTATATLTATNIAIDTNAVATVNGTIASTNPVVNNGTLAGNATITGQLRLVNGSGITGTIAPTGGTVVDAGATVSVDGTLTGSLTIPNATVNTIYGEGKVVIPAGATLAGAGTLVVDTTLASGATIDKTGYETTPLAIPTLEIVPEDEEASATIGIKAGALAHVLTTNTNVTGATFALTMADDSDYVPYPAQTSDDNVATVVAVPKADGTYAVGVVKLNFILGGEALGEDARMELAKSAYREKSILAVEGLYPGSDSPKGANVFTNTFGEFIGNFVYVTYDFGIIGTTVVANASNEKYVVVTAAVEGYSAAGAADYREGTTLTVTATNQADLPVYYPSRDATTGAVTYTDDPIILTELTDEAAKAYGLTPATGVAYFIVAYDNLFPEASETSDTIKLNVKATEATQQDQ